MARLVSAGGERSFRVRRSTRRETSTSKRSQKKPYEKGRSKTDPIFRTPRRQVPREVWRLTTAAGHRRARNVSSRYTKWPEIGGNGGLRPAGPAGWRGGCSVVLRNGFKDDHNTCSRAVPNLTSTEFRRFRGTGRGVHGAGCAGSCHIPR